MIKTIITPAALLLLVTVAGCADTPEGTADSATVPEAAPAPAPTGHAGYVPGNRIDALAVNCKLCDEAPKIRATMEWEATDPGHPMWNEAVIQLGARWERQKAEYGPNSDQALLVRNELVRLRRIALSLAREGGLPTAGVDLVEGILLDGGAVK